MSLSSGEQVIYSTRLSKRIFVKPFVVCLLALILALIFRSIGGNTPVTLFGHVLPWPFCPWFHGSPSIFCPSSW